MFMILNSLLQVRTALKRLQGKVKAFQDQLAASDGAADVARKADLLMAYLHQCAPRASEVTLNDFETAEPVKIALDPSKPALAVAQKMYKRRWVKGNGC
jgi:predicted ribosome quality control (RQC) complex YloA/Tae2 family protein